MNISFYKLECITNLHVGSGDENFNIVDSEVEKDPVTGLPIIGASGIKGALREVVTARDEALANVIFGGRGDKETVNSGTHKFFDAFLIARPMRVSGSPEMASIPVVTVSSVNHFLSMLSAFGKNPFGFEKIEAPDFGEKVFLTNVSHVCVEDEETGLLAGKTLEQLTALSSIIGEQFAITPSFDGFDLPIMARNLLQNGISKNLWFEEFVPHGSVMFFAVMAPEDVQLLDLPPIVQFGGNSSIGYGFSKLTKL